MHNTLQKASTQHEKWATLACNHSNHISQIPQMICLLHFLKDLNVSAKVKITKKGNETHSLIHSTLRTRVHVEALRWDYDKFINKNSSWVQPTWPNKDGNLVQVKRNWCGELIKHNFKHKLHSMGTFGKRHHSL